MCECPGPGKGTVKAGGQGERGPNGTTPLLPLQLSHTKNCNLGSTCCHSGLAGVQTWSVKWNQSEISQASKETTSQYIIWSIKTRQATTQQNLHVACNDAGNRRLALVDGETGWDAAKLRSDWAVEEARELRVCPAWKVRFCGRMLISWWNLMQAGAKLSGGYSRLTVCLLSAIA